jgi:uncharacterized protein YxeA
MNRNLLIIICSLFIVIIVLAFMLFKNNDISRSMYDSELELLKEENKEKYERYKEIEKWNQEIINYLD